MRNTREPRYSAPVSKYKRGDAASDHRTFVSAKGDTEVQGVEATRAEAAGAGRDGGAGPPPGHGSSARGRKLPQPRASPA